MTNTEPSRLDRLEALAETTLLSITELRQAQDRTQQQIDANAVAIAETRKIADSNARSIEASSAASRLETNEVREDLRNATQMILDLGTFFGNQLEQEKLEREALRADVQSLIATLRERFGSNGHGAG